MTAQDLRKLALALPEAIEQGHWGRPSFRVKKKIFATLPDNEQAVLKLPLDVQATVSAAKPETFSVGSWGHQGWTHVQLAAVEPDELDVLVTEAWRQVAPKRVIAAYDSER